jgi:hypothetical protein
VRSLALALCLATATLGASARVRAQSEASSTGKGIAAGVLLGAEAVTVTEAALGVRSGWAYAVGGLAGAAGGGVGGYFLESASARLNIYLLAAGMALVIPTTVAVLNATAYEPPADYVEDRAPIDEPVDNPPEPEDFRTQGRRTSTHTGRHSQPEPLTGLLGYRDGVRLSVPAMTIGDVFSREEVAMYGVGQQTEIQVSVVDFRF